MKTIFSLFFFFAIGLAVHAQQPEISLPNEESTDSVVEVVGWFCVGDTLEYELSSRLAEVVGNDTTILESACDEFRVCVTDSTKNGYVMEYQLTDVAMADTTTLQNLLKLRSARMGINTKVVFTTDELGVFQGIKNRKELYEHSLRLQRQLVDDLYRQMPSRFGDITREEMQKQQKERTDKVFSSKEELDKQYVGLNLLFSFHGKSIELGEHETQNDGASIYTVASKGKIDDEEYSSDEDYRFYCKVTQNQPDGSPIIYYYNYSFFPDGWPREVLFTYVEKQGDKESITQMELSWKTKSWK